MVGGASPSRGKERRPVSGNGMEWRRAVVKSGYKCCGMSAMSRFILSGLAPPAYIHECSMYRRPGPGDCICTLLSTLYVYIEYDIRHIQLQAAEQRSFRHAPHHRWSKKDMRN